MVWERVQVKSRWCLTKSLSNEKGAERTKLLHVNSLKVRINVFSVSFIWWARKDFRITSSCISKFLFFSVISWHSILQQKSEDSRTTLSCNKCTYDCICYHLYDDEKNFVYFYLKFWEFHNLKSIDEHPWTSHLS